MELNENGIKRLPSVEMPWLKYFKDCDIREEVPKKTIYTLAYEMNEDNLKKTAIDVRTSKNDFKYGFKVSYDDLFRRSRIVGKSLSELGVKQDEIIPLIVPNVPEARYFIYGNSYLGSTSYPISPLMPANDLERIIKDGGEPEKLAKEMNLISTITDAQIMDILTRFKQENPKAIADFKTDPKVMSFIIGYVMKNTQGKANGQTVKDLIVKMMNEE